MYPPTIQPSRSNAPFNPIHNYIDGYVTRNQYDSTEATCNGPPLTVTGFKTDTCLQIDNSPTISSVKYICDKGKHNSMQYVDIEFTVFLMCFYKNRL